MTPGEAIDLDAMPESERARLGEKRARYRRDPVLFVREVFKAEPDRWQEEALQACATEHRVAMSACKGPGKSCLLAWVIWWFLFTRNHAQIICCSITADNLRDGLWKELSIWRSRSPLLQAFFHQRGEAIRQVDAPDTWWCSARAFAQTADTTQQANTLAGFHARRIMIVLDEVGDYPEGVFSAADAIFANSEVEGAEPHLVVAGNPTSVTGPLYRVCTKDAKRWRVIHISGDPDDPMRSPRISREWAQQQIDDWGRDNDWVRVNVLGLFPRVGSNCLLGPDDVTLAEGRRLKKAAVVGYPVVFGLDVAREGADRSVLYKRQGPAIWPPVVWRNLDGQQLAERVTGILEAEEERPDYLVVDKGGPGYSAYDNLRRLGWEDIILGVDFGGGANDPRYSDKRAELYDRMARHIREAAALPLGDNELRGELTTITLKWDKRGKRTAFILESKSDLKKRGLPSPDKADGLACTYEAPAHRRAGGAYGDGSRFRAITEDTAST